MRNWDSEVGTVLRAAWGDPGGRTAVLGIVRKMLSSTQEGRQLVSDMLAKELCAAVPGKNAAMDVLSVIHPDGWIDFYGYRDSRLHFYTHLPNCERAGPRLWSEFELETALPERLQKLLWPHATDTKPGHIASAQVRIAQPGGKPAFTWMRCPNQWPASFDEETA